ncbi:hypothetical protein AAHA92_06566 [Salvia divinorum]|uniref:Uncharacterized protein n=1 Tax=Salvia divinorum TaxID=28513 RepID=A0ABD1IA36_SALDI
MRRNEVVNVCGYRRRQRTVWCMSVEERLPEGSGCVCRLPRAAAGVGSRGSGGLLRMRQPGARVPSFGKRVPSFVRYRECKTW